MTYKMRNILVLAGLVAFISLISGYIIFFHHPGKINKLNDNIQELKKQISALDGIEQEFYKLEEVIKEEEEKLKKLDKKVNSTVTPAATYNYLNTILKYSGLLEFNLFYSGEKKTKGFHYNIYRVKGEGSFYRLYRFISYLENGPEFYKINKLKMHMVEDKDENTGVREITVPFEMELWALYANVENLPEIRRTLADVRVKRPSSPFHPYIYSNIPANHKNLLVVERASLKALLPDRAMVSDNNGKIHVLREGDEVYLGYLSKIHHKQNFVEFVLNKGGIVEKFKLEMRFDKKIN